MSMRLNAEFYEKIQGMRTPKQFDDVKAELERRLESAEKNYRDRVAIREQAIFGGKPEEFRTAHSRVSEASEEIEVLRLMLDGLERRRKEVADSGRMEAIEAEMKQARQKADRLRSAYAEFHKHATAVARLGKEISTLDTEIKIANDHAVANGRPELRVESLYAELAEAQQREVGSPFQNMRILYYTGGHDPEKSPFAKL